MKKIAICKIDEVPVNGLKQFETDGRKLCLVNAGDRFFACQATCPHENIDLCEGVFDGEVLTCIEHLWQWNLRTGGEPLGRAEVPLEMAEVEADGDTVYLRS